MSAIILIILGAGILAVGYLRGWFDRADETLALLTDVKGTVNLEREGVLFPVTVQFNEGETVLDVLQRVCDAAGIHLEFSWTPMYNSYYIEGINQLYEFDCGFESGWMYKVNGWFPNYGCSSYTLTNGDVIEWHYTCKGLGADLGAPQQ